MYMPSVDVTACLIDTSLMLLSSRCIVVVHVQVFSVHMCNNDRGSGQRELFHNRLRMRARVRVRRASITKLIIRLYRFEAAAFYICL